MTLTNSETVLLESMLSDLQNIRINFVGRSVHDAEHASEADEQDSDDIAIALERVSRSLVDALRRNEMAVDRLLNNYKRVIK